MMFRKYVSLKDLPIEEAQKIFPSYERYPSIEEQLDSHGFSALEKSILKSQIKETMMQIAEEAIDHELSIPKTE